MWGCAVVCEECVVELLGTTRQQRAAIVLVHAVQQGGQLQNLLWTDIPQ